MLKENQIFLSVIVTAYEEKDLIGHTLLEIGNFLSNQEYGYEIIVVVDGSSDNTAEIAKNYSNQIKKLRVIDNKENRGKGYIIRQGILESKGKYVVFLDADGSTSITHVEKFLPEFEKGFDLVIGSRKIKGAFMQVRQSRLRELMGAVSNFLIRVVLGLWNYSDTQCGFKMLTGEAARELAKRTVVDRFGFDFELIALAEKMGFEVKQMPVRWLNEENSAVRLMGPNGFFRALADLFRTKHWLMAGKYDIDMEDEAHAGEIKKIRAEH